MLPLALVLLDGSWLSQKVLGELPTPAAARATGFKAGAADRESSARTKFRVAERALGEGRVLGGVMTRPYSVRGPAKIAFS